jgi:hypothetical protein
VQAVTMLKDERADKTFLVLENWRTAQAVASDEQVK